MWETGLTSLLPLLPTDAVPAWPAGGRVCGGLRGAHPGHPLPGLLLHCPPLLHPGSGPEQGPASVSPSVPYPCSISGLPPTLVEVRGEPQGPQRSLEH